MECDGKNRMNEFTMETSLGVIAQYRYLYDHRGRRILSINKFNDHCVFYLRDFFSGQVLTEYHSDSSNNPWWKRNNAFMGRKLVYSESTQDEPGQTIANGLETKDAIPLSANNSDTYNRIDFSIEKRYYHHDHLDSPNKVTQRYGNG